MVMLFYVINGDGLVVHLKQEARVIDIVIHYIPIGSKRLVPASVVRKYQSTCSCYQIL